MTLYHETYMCVTAGSTYLDIDAYACCTAMAELLSLQGKHAVAYSTAPCNYSVCSSLTEEGRVLTKLPVACQAELAEYIIVDVSDPEYIKDAVPLDRVVEVYDHHVGFEEYWNSRIGEGSHIEFIGAAATLIYRQWKQAGLQDQMSRATTLLLIAAILDNTLNLTSSNTTEEDVWVFHELCQRANVGKEWCASYFAQVQAEVEADLRNALFNDIKTIRSNETLPPRVAQLCVWDVQSILDHLTQIRQWLNDDSRSWMINIIDIQHRCSYFVCDDIAHQERIAQIFGVDFTSGVAQTSIPYLRKEIIKKTQ